MLNMNKILVPVDFSERSTVAAEHAVVMANHFGSELIFAHVIPFSPYHYAAFESGLYVGTSWPSQPEMEAALEKKMSAFVAGVSSGRKVTEVVAKGDPAKKIEEIAAENKADLIILPTHGYGPFRRFILGSVTSKVLHDVTCPVFTGSHVSEVPVFGSKPYKRVACAIDLGGHSEAVLRWAAEFARSWDTDLVAIHAAPLLDAAPAQGQFYSAELRQGLIRSRRERIEELLHSTGCEAEVRVEVDEVSHYVPSVVRDVHADVLVIGRTPPSGLLGRLRTHAYALIRESPCPVISI